MNSFFILPLCPLSPPPFPPLFAAFPALQADDSQYCPVGLWIGVHLWAPKRGQFSTPIHMLLHQPGVTDVRRHQDDFGGANHGCPDRRVNVPVNSGEYKGWQAHRFHQSAPASALICCQRIGRIKHERTPAANQDCMQSSILEDAGFARGCAGGHHHVQASTKVVERNSLVSPGFAGWVASFQNGRLRSASAT